MKKNTLLKAICFGLCASMLTACGGGGEGTSDGGNSDGGASGGAASGGASNPEQTEFEIVGGMSALSGGYDGNEVLNKMMENVGCTIEWDTMSDSLAEQVNIKIAGDILPDAFLGVGFNNIDINTHGQDGVFIDLTPYINAETMPNLTAILDEYPDVRAAITMENGCIYGLPSGEMMGTGGIGKDYDYSIYTIPQYSMINKKWLDELGLAVPTNLDELYNALKAFKDNDMATTYGNAPGTTIPMSTGFDQWCWGQNIFYAGFGFTNWPSDVINDIVLGEDGKCRFVCVDDAYRDAVTYFHKWYDEGLMDIEMFSQSTNQLIAKCSQGQVGVATWWYIDEVMGDKAADYVFLPVLDGPTGTAYEGKHNVTVRDGGAVTSGMLNITKACGNPELLLKFFDQWYTGEAVMQLQYGPIGTYFTKQDDKGMWLSITDDEAREKFNKSAGELKGVYEVYGPKLILSKYYNEVFYMEDRAIERLNDLVWWMEDSGASPVCYPSDCVFTSDELEVIDRYRSDFESTVSEQEANWIKNGGPTDQEWADYKEKLSKSCGMEQLLEAYQGAYDRYASNS